jgi:hypothetical protein
LKRKLTPEAVAAIRASLESNAALGRQFGVSKQTISQIRQGLIHKLPEVDHLDQSNVGAYCFRCVHWNPAGDGSCSLGFPEAALEGQLAARDCGAFSKQQAQP